MTTGCIIRDHFGKVQGLLTNNFGKGNALKAETLAMREGLLEAKRQGLEKIHIEGDSQILINACNSNNPHSWQINMLVTEIKKIMTAHFSKVKITFTPRQLNSVADFLSKQSHRSLDWFHSNSEFKTLILRNALGRPPDDG